MALPRVPATAMVLGSILSVQVGAAFAKGLFGQVPPVSMTWLRVTAAALVLVPLARPWRALPRPAEDGARDRWALLGWFTVFLLGMNVCIYLAIDKIPLGVAVTIEFLGPLGVAVLGSRRARDLLWVVMAGLGVAVLGLSPGRLDPLGVLFALVAAACWAGYIVVGARMGGTWRGLDALAIACLVGSVGLAPIALPGHLDELFTPPVLATGLAVGVLSTVVPYTLELAALKHLAPATFGILMSLEPAVAALAAWVVLREALGAADWTAMACVIVASAGATLDARRRTRRAAPRP